MRELKIAFENTWWVFGDESSWQSYRRFLPRAKYPAWWTATSCLGIAGHHAEFLADGMPVFGRAGRPHARGREARRRRCMPDSANCAVAAR